MQLKFISKQTLVIVAIGIVLGLAVSLILIFYFTPQALTQGNFIPIPLPKIIINLLIQKKEIIGLPARFKIPAINIDSAIEHVGVTIAGAMDVPKGPANVAWFKFGPRPGEKGSAVIAGHEGWKNGIPAVFDNLYKLKKGDKLYSEDENGLVITFVVREVRIYGQYDDASDVFGSSDGKIHLNLITCQGVWNKYLKSYSKRLVVFTDKES